KKENLIKLFIASLTDINKIFYKLNQLKDFIEIKSKLLSFYYKYLNIFNKIIIDILPPHHPGIDYTI
ncbi:hypothetical protein BO79DRAFT_108445, partial [Aspergillus costaricaensis CBS 115574]